MKRRPPKPHQVNPVEVEHNGEIHRAEYTIESGVVIVRYGMMTNQAIPTHPSLHLIEAKRLLKEILDGGKWRF